MSMSKVSNRWLNRVYKIIAILLVVFALLISGLRLFLPYAHNYRIELQDYINTTYGSNIAIGSLNMSWQSSGPILVASNVSVLQTDSAEVFITGFNVQVDFWRSFQQQQLVTKDFALDGLKVLLDRKVLANTGGNNDTNLINNVSKLFLHQISKFSIDDSQIIVQTPNGDRTFLIDELFWINQGKQHKAKGSVILDGVTSNNLQLDLNVTGETLQEMRGQVYIQANQLDITPWLDRVFAIDEQDTHSTINFNAWLTITEGKAERLLVDLGENKVTWTYQDTEKLFAISPGQLMIKNLSSNNALTGYTSELMVTSDEHIWQPLTVEFNNHLSGFSGYISSAELSGIADLMPLFVKQQQTLDIIDGLSPQGVLQDIFIEQVNGGNLQASAKFNGLTTNYQQGIPGVEQLKGEINLLNQKLNVNISANAGALDFAEHFKAPIAYDALNAKVELEFGDGRWSVTVPSIEFIAPELKLSAELGVFGEDDLQTQMSLFANLQDINVVDASKFYPQSVMGQSLIDFLNSALKKGTVKQANVLINGPIANFPFEDGSGYFNVDAELNNSTFIFDEQWPAITHFDAHLNFKNNSMLVTGLSGSLTGINVAGVTAKIDDLSNEQILKINADFNQTQPKLVTNLMLASPLSDSVGNVLEKLALGKPFSGSLDLTLPINDIDSTVAKGEIILADNSVDLQSPNMHFSQVNGKVTFENEKVTSTDLNLLWRNMPMRLTVNTEQLPVYFQTKIKIDADWENGLWLKQLPSELQKYGEGQLSWQGDLVLNHYNDGDFAYNFVLHSDLQQLDLMLPEPFAKSSEQKMTTQVRVVGNLTQSTLDAHIGEQLTFYGKLDHEKTTFTQSHLILGNEPMFLPVSGFHVTTALETAAFEQWQPFIVDLLAGIEQPSDTADSDSILPQPERIRGNINKVTFVGEALHDVSFNLTDETSWWLLSLSSVEARAGIKLFPDIQTQGLEINADYIRLAASELLITDNEDNVEATPTSDTLDNTPFDIRVNDEVFANIPPLSVSCAECSYRNLQLGKVDFQLRRPAPDLIAVNNFVAKRKGSKLQFDGQWQHNSDNSVTSLKGTLESKDLERELEMLGVSSTVADSGLKAKFDVNWLGGPQDFQLRHFNGDVSARLDEGVLKEVPDSARALSLLSLQSLVRKLKFDFRDIFADGMFYSEIKGDYHLQNGVLYTKNTFLKGAAGDLSLKGNTDLNTKTLDYSMSYAPNVTSSLPAIAWIATLNPVTFLAGVAIDGVITSQVPVEYKFALTGSISEPNFRQIDKKTKNISVGRDSPPKVVETLPEIPVEPKIEGVLNPETGLIEPIDKHQLDQFYD